MYHALKELLLLLYDKISCRYAQHLKPCLWIFLGHYRKQTVACLWDVNELGREWLGSFYWCFCFLAKSLEIKGRSQFPILLLKPRGNASRITHLIKLVREREGCSGERDRMINDSGRQKIKNEHLMRRWGATIGMIAEHTLDMLQREDQHLSTHHLFISCLLALLDNTDPKLCMCSVSKSSPGTRRN